MKNKNKILTMNTAMMNNFDLFKVDYSTLFITVTQQYFTKVFSDTLRDLKYYYYKKYSRKGPSNHDLRPYLK